jgi:excisionase family DNA binding protein
MMVCRPVFTFFRLFRLLYLFRWFGMIMSLMMLSNAHDGLGGVAPTDRDASMARESSRRLSPFATQDLRVRLAEGDGPDIELPAAAVQLLVHLLTQMAQGNAVTLVPIRAELTTQQAAALLGVSRPFLIKELDAGKLPFRKVGTHRRVLVADLMRYKESMDAQRHAALDELTQESQHLRLGY